MKELHPIMSIIGKHVVMDLIDSWPRSVLYILENNRELIKQYLDEETRLYELYKEDILKWHSTLPNKYKRSYMKVVRAFNRCLVDQSFIGFHASRLTSEEIINLISEGLQPLSLELVMRKLDVLIKNHLITNNDVELILQNNSSNNACRNSKVFLNHSLSRLKDSSWHTELFKYWGGESISRHFRRESEISTKLKTIGTPCIVICYFIGIDMVTHPSVSERMIKFWNGLQISEHDFYDSDSIVEHKVDVVKVITQEDDLFDILSDYNT